MRRLAPLLFALAACTEPAAIKITPTDRFAYPASLAVMATEAGGTALLVASGNYDLTYDGPTGGTLLSVDPAPAAQGGSAGAPDQALVKYGTGAHVGSFAGQVAVVDDTTCPGWSGTGQPPLALLNTRFADQIWRLPLGADGSVGECQGSACTLPMDPGLHDPFGLSLACRPDGQRRTAFIGYLRTAVIGSSGTAGWLAEVDLERATAPARLLEIGGASLAGLAYDASRDRIYVLTEPLLSALVYVFDLGPCPAGLASCPAPVGTAIDLYPLLNGIDLQAIALSNDQAGLPRRAYVTARVYDPNLAVALRYRPASDVAAVMLVFDLEESTTGRPSFQLLRTVPIGMGTSQIAVLPVRPPATAGGAPRRDVVVITSAVEGVVTVYDDEEGQVVRVIPIDDATGAPQIGRAPFGLAVDPVNYGTASAPVARLYAAAVHQELVGLLDVPLDTPGQADVPRDASGAIVRIGGLQ